MPEIAKKYSKYTVNSKETVKIQSCKLRSILVTQLQGRRKVQKTLGAKYHKD